MSTTRVVSPTSLSVVLRRCSLSASARFRVTTTFRLTLTHQPFAARLRASAVVDRPAWQSPYGPPQRRSHRGRWVPEPGVGRSLPVVVRRGQLCEQCD
ncbi:hypothetical protein H8N01_00685 [Streptomyces sp. AC536]|uniref:hypothetical protein n=1 Tax=Streptomyces buecherae TaxID=2763006 RepID=UPI00164E835C|nr:hypothetical protein [Streptomyces buecherae]MBC3981128.1 hypothetical protein [Streptomyces buecherae]QNJ41878.1 hypothetical protein H7H31_20405 [Streptomyces buecherae]